MSFAADLIAHDFATDISTDPLEYLQNKNMMLYFGEEAIAFQAKSKAGIELDKLFDECFEIKAKEFDQDEMNIVPVCDKIIKHMEPKIKDIFLKHFNIDIKKFHFNTNKYPDCSTAIAFGIIDNEAAAIGKDIINGTNFTGTSGNIPKKYIRRLEEIINTAKSLDLDTGKLKSAKWPIELYLDPPLFFFTEQFIHGDKGISAEGMSSREITSIILHEAGHAITFLEKIVYGYAAQKQIDNYVNGLLKSDLDFEDIKEFCTKVCLPSIDKAMTNNQETHKELRKEILENATMLKSVVQKIVGFCDIIYKAKNDDNSQITSDDDEIKKINVSDIKYPGNADKFDFVCTIIVKVLKIILRLVAIFVTPLIIMCSMGTAMGSVALSQILQILIIVYFCNPSMMGNLLADRNISLNNGKTGDLLSTNHNVYNFERIADEFVVRQGYGGELASSLDKIGNVFPNGYATTNTLVRQSKFIQYLSLVEKLLMDITLRGYIYSIYEDEQQRCRRICQSCIAIFKNNNLSKGIRDHYTEQMKKSLQILEKYGKDYCNRDEYQTLKSVLVKLVTPAEWVRAFTTRTLSQQYEAHLNELENLSNNLLYFNSSQLKSLSSSMK